VPEAEVRDQAAEFLSRMETGTRVRCAELRGVAAGNRVDETDIAALNARYEVLCAALLEAERGNGRLHKLRFALRDDGGRPYIRRTELGLDPPSPTLITTEVYPDNGPNHLGVTEAGIVGAKMGVNDAGIRARRQQARHAGRRGVPFRKPFHVRCRGSTIRGIRQSTEAAHRNPSPVQRTS